MHNQIRELAYVVSITQKKRASNVHSKPLAISRRLTILTATISKVSIWVAAAKKKKKKRESQPIRTEKKNRIKDCCEMGRRRERRLTEVYFAEGSASDLAAKLVLGADDAFHASKVPEQSG